MRLLVLLVLFVPTLSGCAAAASIAVNAVGNRSNPCNSQILNQTDAIVRLKPGNLGMCYITCTGEDRVRRRLTVYLKPGEEAMVTCPDSGEPSVVEKK